MDTGPALGGASELLKQGVLGIVSALLIAALVWVTKNWKKAMEDRIEDAKGFGNALKEVNNANTNLIVETNKSSDAAKASIEGLKAESINVRSELTKLRDEQVKLIVATKGSNG
jgi:hypothetical protein